MKVDRRLILRQVTHGIGNSDRLAGRCDIVQLACLPEAQRGLMRAATQDLVGGPALQHHDY